MENIVTAFEAEARKRPDALAIKEGEIFLGYGELNKKANQLAHFLRAEGLERNAVVALCLKRSSRMLLAILAILKAGAAWVPLDPDHPEERLLFTLKDNQNPMLLMESAQRKQFQRYSGRAFNLDDLQDQIAAQPVEDPKTSASTDDLAYIIYTSGSTGRPKGVLIEHASVLNYARWFQQFCALEAGERIDFSANYIFDMSISVSVVPLMLGLTVVICDEETRHSPRRYLEYLRENGIQLIKITPGYLRILLHETAQQTIDLPQLKHLVLGGENLTKRDCENWLSFYPHQRLYNEYGPTEATIAVCQQQITPENIGQFGINIPIGKTDPSMRCLILDANQKPLPPGEQGELYIGGLCLARGYLNQPEINQSRFLNLEKGERLYRTGDLCRELPDGSIEFLGRMDEQVKIRGFRIEPQEIVQQLLKHPALAQALVFAPEEELPEKRLVAYYQLKEGKEAPSSKDLRHFLSIHLPDWLIPSAFICMASFPLTANNKLDKRAFPLPEPEPSSAYRAPQTEMERCLARIWEKELALKNLGLDDNFFEVGGHSLSAARVISQLSHLLDKDLSLTDLYEAPTIASLLPRIEKAAARQKISARKMKDGESFPLGDFQFMLWLCRLFAPHARKLNLVSSIAFKGSLQKEALILAFRSLIAHQEVLRYQIFSRKPAQKIQLDPQFQLEEEDLRGLDREAQQKALTISLRQLSQHHWSRRQALIQAKLSWLDADSQVLQLALPHLIADEISMQLLRQELSENYLSITRVPLPERKPANAAFRLNIAYEQQTQQAFLDRDIAFWKNYLLHTGFFPMPPNQVQSPAEARRSGYSTWLPFPRSLLQKLQLFCRKEQLNRDDTLSAALILALCKVADLEENQTIVINRVKSTRNDPRYDQAMGCFLRVEPLRLCASSRSSLQALAGQIRQSVLQTLPYQSCPSLIKLACIGFEERGKRLRSLLSRLLMSIYGRLTSLNRVDRTILTFAERLSFSKESNQFLININIQNGFYSSQTDPGPQSFCGLACERPEIIQDDLLQIDQFLDLVFCHDPANSNCWLVLSANLQPDFREAVGKKAVTILEQWVESQGVDQTEIRVENSRT